MRRIILAAFCLTLAPWGCSNQDAPNEKPWEWVAIETANRPPARYDAAMTMDEQTDKLYVYGGRMGQGQLADFWSLDLSAPDKNWTMIEEQASPGARSGAVLMALGGGRLLLHGGYRADHMGESHFLQDLWFYDQKNGWQREFISKGPGPRAWHQARALRDSSGQTSEILFFGGYAPAPDYHLNDLWALDLHAPKWRRVATDGGPKGHGRPLLWLAAGGQRLRVFNREGIPSPESTGIWSLKLAEDRWERRPNLDPSPPVDFHTVGDRAQGDAWLVLQGPDLDGLRPGWNVWTCKPSQAASWTRGEADEGPRHPVGMSCLAEPAREDSWLCFGGARRQEISDGLWRLRVDERGQNP